MFIDLKGEHMKYLTWILMTVLLSSCGGVGDTSNANGADLVSIAGRTMTFYHDDKPNTTGNTSSTMPTTLTYNYDSSVSGQGPGGAYSAREWTYSAGTITVFYNTGASEAYFLFPSSGNTESSGTGTYSYTGLGLDGNTYEETGTYSY